MGEVKIRINNPHKPIRVENCVIEGSIEFTHSDYCQLPMWRRALCWIQLRWPLAKAVEGLSGGKAYSPRWWSGHSIKDNTISGNRIETLIEVLERLRTENKEMEHIFNLQQKRMEQATAMWRAGNPGNDDVLPDLGDLLEWLMAEIDARALRGEGE